MGVGFEAAQDEQLGVQRQRLGHLRVDLEHADLPRETGLRHEETQVALQSGGSVTRVEPDLKHGCLRFSQFVEWWFASGHFYDGASQGPDVSRGSVPPGALIDDLWSHVLQRACHSDKDQDFSRV